MDLFPEAQVPFPVLPGPRKPAERYNLSNPSANRIGLRTTLGSGGSGAGEPRGNHKSSCGKPWQPRTLLGILGMACGMGFTTLSDHLGAGNHTISGETL